MQDLLQVKNLRIAFQLPEGRLEAVRGVSFRVAPGATVALVGESGSGKSVVSQAITGILPKSARIEVAIPCRSSSAATRLTAWLQKGQTGTRIAKSTLSETSSLADLGAVSRMRRPGAVIDPMKER